MKKISAQEAESQLGELIAQAYRGEMIVLTDGDNEVTMIPRRPLDLEADSPETRSL